MRKLPVGTKVNLFERDSLVAEECLIKEYDGDYIYLETRNKLYKIKNTQIKEIEISIETKSGFLEQYEVKRIDDNEK